MRKRLLLIVIVFLVTAVGIAHYQSIPEDAAAQNRPNLYWGYVGHDVRLVQSKLKQWGYYNGAIDGIYGSATQNAVRKFQAKNGLRVDGLVGPATWRALGFSTRSSSTAYAAPRRTLYWGSRGNDVRLVQSRLKQWGYYNGAVDGIFGNETSQAVKRFQAKNGLTPDGLVGPRTWEYLGFSTVTAAQPAITRARAQASRGVSSSNDVNLLARLVAAEAEGEPYVGQVAVAAVILNRVKNPQFPNTLAGVIYQPGAFESITNGLAWSRTPSSTAIKAARDAMNGWDPTYGCIFFWNPAKPVSSKWIWSRQIVTRIGSHVFAK